LEHGNLDPGAGPAKLGKLPSPVTSRTRNGVPVVVRARESRAQGEGGQQRSANPKPQGEATYVASELDKSWLLIEQRKAYARSMQEPDFVFRKLWGLITDPRNLRIAVERVARNRGRRTAGVDGNTVRRVLRKGGDDFVDEVRSELRSGRYTASVRAAARQARPGRPAQAGAPRRNPVHQADEQVRN
jgi:hypothetical protein